jgi:hypothetical protein
MWIKSMQLELGQQQSYRLFTNSIRSEETRKTYTLLLKKFIEYLDEDDILLGNDAKQIERRIIDYIILLKASDQYQRRIIVMHSSRSFLIH